MQPSSQRLCTLLVCHLFICRHLYGGKELSHILINIMSKCLIRSGRAGIWYLGARNALFSSHVSSHQHSCTWNNFEIRCQGRLCVVFQRSLLVGPAPSCLAKIHFVPTRGHSSFSFVRPQSGVEPSRSWWLPDHSPGLLLSANWLLE